MKLKLQSTHSLKAKILTLVSVITLLVLPVYAGVANHVVNAIAATNYTAANPSDLSWSADRRAPATFTNDSTNITIGIASSNASSEPDWSYNRIEGMSTPISSSNSIKATLYIDPAWKNIDNVEVGIWGVSPIGTYTSFPKIAFTNRNNTPEVRAYNTFGSATAPISDLWEAGIPVEYGKSYALELAQNPDTNEFEFYVDNNKFHSYPSTKSYGTALPFSKMIFNNHNPGGAENSYTVKWSDLQLGVKSQITNVDAYYSIDTNYSSIGVDFKTKNVTTAASIKLQVNRIDGAAPYFIEATPSLVSAINAASDPTSTSGPIVITGERTSSSWTNQKGTWTGPETPESVDVIITLTNGEVITFRDNVIGSLDGATWEDVKPAAVKPVVESIAPAKGSLIKGNQRIDIKVANSNDVRTGNLQLNKVTAEGQAPLNSGLKSYTLQRDATGWYATVDTTSLSGDGKYLFKVEAHGFDTPHGYYGNNSAWQYPDYYLNVDNAAPKITSVNFDEIRSYNGRNFTGARLNNNKLSITFTTNEPLKISGSQVGLKIPTLSGVPATGWTTVQLVDDNINKYVANIDLVNRTNTGIPGYTDFFKDKLFEGINLYFQLTDTIGNSKNTYYATDSAGKPIDDWTTNSGDARNYKFTLDNLAPVLTVEQDFSKALSNNDSIVVKGTDDSGIREIHANVRKVNNNGTVEKDPITGLKFDFNSSDVLTEVNHEVKLGDLLNGAGLESGNYQFRTSGQDVALNSSSAQNFLFTVNNQAPEAKITADGLNSGDLTNNKNITFTGTGTPSNLGTAIKTHFFELKTPLTTHNIYSFNNSAGKKCTLNGVNTCSFSLANYYDIDGKYEVRYVVTDEQGHRNDGHGQPWVVGTAKSKFVLNVDTENPTVSISENHNGFVSGHNSWKNARNVNVTIDDKNTGETALHRDSDGSTVKTYINDGAEFSISIGLPEGAYYLVHTDKAGNKSDRKYFTISNQKPNIHHTEGLTANDATVVGPINTTVKFRADNGDSVNATVDEVKIRGWVYDETKPENRGSSAFSDFTYESLNENGEYEFDIKKLLGDKFVHGAKFIIRIQAKNTANVHSSFTDTTYTIEVNLQAPVITINTAGPFTTSRPTIAGTVGTGAETVEVSIDGGVNWDPVTAHNRSAGTWSYTYTTELSNTSHTIQVRATDGVGNIGSNNSEQGFAATDFAVNVNTGTSTGEATDQRQPSDPPTIDNDDNSPPIIPRVLTQASQAPLIFGFTPATVESTENTDETNENDTDVAAVTDTQNNNDRDNGDVLAAEDSKEQWSIVNLLLAIIIGLIGLYALFGMFGKKDGAKSNTQRFLAILPAVGAVATLYFVENFNSSMGIVNLWTVLIAALLIVQLILLPSSKAPVEQ